MKPKNLRSWIKQITFFKVDWYPWKKTIIAPELPGNVILLQKHGIKTEKENVTNKCISAQNDCGNKFDLSVFQNLQHWGKPVTTKLSEVTNSKE